jgi:hypothetical protein
MIVPILIYTHSEYSFLWPVILGQFTKYNEDCEVHFLYDEGAPQDLLDKYIPSKWIRHTYDPSDIWTDRIKTALVKMEAEYLLFIHDDWIPVAPFSNKRLDESAEFMKSKNCGFLLSHHNYGCDMNCEHSLVKTEVKEFQATAHPDYMYQNEPHHIFQVALWKRETFIQYTIRCKKTKNTNEDLESLRFMSLQNCWSVQNMTTEKTIRTMNSYIFPHMHILSEGKWNLTKYPTLKSLLESYGLETESRGDHPWWELDTQ